MKRVDYHKNYLKKPKFDYLILFLNIQKKNINTDNVRGINLRNRNLIPKIKRTNSYPKTYKNA